MSSVRQLLIFISSPSDVLPERVVAERVVARLAQEFASYFQIRAVRWEHEPMLATQDFQENIIKPSRTDIVLCVLWSRIGKVLNPEKWTGPITGQPVTGTEWEFEDALAAFRANKRPAILVYRKQKNIEISLDDEKLTETRLADAARVKQFVQKWFVHQESGAFLRAILPFTEPDDFEELITKHLRELIRRELDAATAGSVGAETIAWHQGSPFRGLESFDVEHSAIFFGRTRARTELRHALVAQQACGRGFVVVVGASGSGKSSLVRAGLLPDLVIPGVVEGVGLCRYAIVRPSDTAGNFASAVASALLSPSALPELTDTGYDVARLGALLEEAPQHARTPIKEGLRRAGQKARLAAHAEARLALVVDQLEEVFAETAARQLALGDLLEELTRGPEIWVIATLRSDFLPRIGAIPRLAEMMSGRGHYLIPPPRESEIAQMVRLPAQSAGVRFEMDPESGIALDEEIIQTASRNPADLPLLEYLLDELWRKRSAQGVLMYAVYRQLGGVGGALGNRAEEAFGALTEPVQSAFPNVLRSLVTVQSDEHGNVTGRPAPLDRFAEDTPARALVDALVSPAARLLVAEGDGESARIRLSHETLLQHWPRARRQIEADYTDLKIRARLESDAAAYARASGENRDSLLLPSGLRLSEAEDLLARRESDLAEDVRDYIRKSRDADTSRRSRLEWERLDSEAAKLRAMVEDHHARALRNELLAEQVKTQRARPDRDEYVKTLNRNAAQFRKRAAELWGQASQIEVQLKVHPGAPSLAEKRALRQPAVFTLEVLGVPQGECLLVHYGSPDAPKLVLVDGGPQTAFARCLRPRLCELRERLTPGQSLPLELVMVSHPDNDRLRGVLDLLSNTAETVRRGEQPLAEIRRLWYNHFVSISAAGAAASGVSLQKTMLPKLARELRIPLNAPFDYFVMPADTGPARLQLAGGLSITVLGPPASRIREWSRMWKEMQKAAKSDSRSLADELGTLSDGFSSPEITLLRSNAGMESIARPAEFQSEYSGRFLDMSVANLSSIVAMLEIYGRSMLLTGDARGDEILKAVIDAGYLGADGRVHVDILKLPHYGSTRTLSAEFFAMIAADHYVMASFTRHKLPNPEVVGMIAASRRADEFQIHISLDEDTAGLKSAIEQVFEEEKGRGCRGTLHFREESSPSTLIHLADTPRY